MNICAKALWARPIISPARVKMVLAFSLYGWCSVKLNSLNRLSADTALLFGRALSSNRLFRPGNKLPSSEK